MCNQCRSFSVELRGGISANSSVFRSFSVCFSSQLAAVTRRRTVYNLAILFLIQGVRTNYRAITTRITFRRTWTSLPAAECSPADKNTDYIADVLCVSTVGVALREINFNDFTRLFYSSRGLQAVDMGFVFLRSVQYVFFVPTFNIVLQLNAK